jgi:hypothetical protein
MLRDRIATVRHAAPLLRIMSFVSQLKGSAGGSSPFPTDGGGTGSALAFRLASSAVGPTKVRKPAMPLIEPILQFFSYAHLRPDLRDVSRPFGELADQMVLTLPRNPERTVALRKLLEAKDAAVRAALYRDDA